MPDTNFDLRTRLHAWVLEKAADLPADELTDDTPLFERRYLRSVHVPELLQLIERLRGQPIDADDLRRGDFRDIATMVDRFGGGVTQAAPELAAAPVTESRSASADIGLRWEEATGQVRLHGPLLELWNRIDQAVVALAALWDAEAEQHPAMIDLAVLDRLGYLRGFAHQATFVALPGNDTGGEPAVTAGQPMPVAAALTPAACYHIYIAHQGEKLDSTKYFTTRNVCFRHEQSCQPLRRQRVFGMREIVCLGTRDCAAAFVVRARDVVDRFCRELDIPLQWEGATDPFFAPATDPRALLQRISAVKTEARFDDLALASTNKHHEHFGELMDITCGSAPAHSACLAFGLERWLFAITARHGNDPAAWPDPIAAATAVAAELRGVAA
ncbi:hypothetical protein OG203_43940 [Nocardia sp. NBC_01499]|uniref:hypothetical protein n=1 Tax=Nocardia sp. NBC_01499 TaxID=2903597 RepID=UPI00386471AB